jgi:hypothetical protein
MDRLPEGGKTATGITEILNIRANSGGKLGCNLTAVTNAEQFRLPIQQIQSRP